ncbi:MAG: Rne/Rng family ribonuclease [Deltaproteobacteria bacterium]|nr:Rne/Rng family ribonuclease [Deltaproteobacteria bacterium]
MANLLLISVAEYDTRVALVEDGRLVEIHLELSAQDGPTGNIYKGRVVKLLPGMAAAFVDVGLERPAYLFAEDVSAQEDEFYHLWLPPEEGAPGRRVQPTAIEELLHEGQEILVQVLRGPMGGKGARLTTHITLAGHCLVYMPTFPQLGVSRRITEEGERQRLRGLLEELRPGEGGLIARTAARGADREELAREQETLVNLWKRIQRKKDAAAAPSLLHQEMDTVRRLVRELYTPEIDRVVVDEPRGYERVQQYLESLNSLEKYRVELYSGPESIFSHFGVDLEWKRLLAPQVWLKSGGHLLFGSTEALTAIDVNTGRFVGRHHWEETILKTNLEAAKEITRQLRLRNIGGLIVIDFIDMEKAANRELVYQELAQGLKHDRAKTTVLPISPLGLVEMTRQRLRGSLGQAVTEPCSCCGGKGAVISPLVLACDLLRQLAAEAREFPRCRLVVEVNPEVGAVLKEEGERLFQRLAAGYQVQVEIIDRPNFLPDQFEITHELV